jgi:hypothetical protein
MSKVALPYYLLLIAFGVFAFVYGGYDDSPGAQLMGAMIVAASATGAVKRWRAAAQSKIDLR